MDGSTATRGGLTKKLKWRWIWREFTLTAWDVLD